SPRRSSIRALPAAGSPTSAAALKGGPPRATVLDVRALLCTSARLAPSSDSALTASSRRLCPAAGNSGDHQMRVCADSSHGAARALKAHNIVAVSQGATRTIMRPASIYQSDAAVAVLRPAGRAHPATKLGDEIWPGPTCAYKWDQQRQTHLEDVGEVRDPM